MLLSHRSPPIPTPNHVRMYFSKENNKIKLKPFAINQLMLKGTSKSSVSHSAIFGLWLDSGQQKSGWVSRISPPLFYIE